jgi:hypothetical protein
MQTKDLKPNKRNPRKMSQDELDALKESIEVYGDLSGFLYNRRTKSLFGGHQKIKVIPPDSKIKIEKKYDKPTRAYTVSEGYIIIYGERFKYREVDAPEEWEWEAMIAANKHSGDWDQEILRVGAVDFKDTNWARSGFKIPELKAFNIPAPILLKPMINPLNAIEDVGELPGDQQQDAEQSETDEDYVKNTAQTTEQISVEQIGSPFDKIDEKMDVVGKRFVIIIDCAHDKMKQDLKEKIRVEVEMMGGKFF